MHPSGTAWLAERVRTVYLRQLTHASGAVVPFIRAALNRDTPLPNCCLEYGRHTAVTVRLPL